LGENDRGINNFTLPMKNTNQTLHHANSIDPYDKMDYDLEDNQPSFDEEFLPLT
jgi:hypothetical protein